MMSKTRIIKRFVLLLVLGSAGCVAYAAVDGGALYKAKGCIACHGADAKSPLQPNYPKLSGQSEAYLVQQMTDIQSGQRNNSNAPTMRPVVHNLAAAEMKSIAAWLSSKNARGLYEQKGCPRCHGDDAKTPAQTIYPKLAGQNRDYLIQEMKDIQTGSRSNSMSAAMKLVIHSLTDAEIDTLGTWLSSLNYD